MKYKQITAVLVSACLLLAGCAGFEKKQNPSYTDTLFYTVIKVQILGSADEDVLKGLEKLCKDYDKNFSMTNEEGELYKINHAQGAPVEVSDDMVTLIQKGIYYSEFSRGAFDITIGSVSSLWDFKEAKVVPSSDAIQEALTHINYKNIHIQNNTVQLTDPYTQIDLGAIAKGYIADRIKDYLEEQGVKHATINLGGNIQTIGTKPDGSDYNIGIQKPFDETGEPITSVKIKDKSIVTTGIYQRYFEQDGTLYHHVLDPRTGMPCDTDLYSVSIITDSSLTADAMSTVCCLMGYQESMNVISQLDNVDAVFVTDDGNIKYSSNFQKKQPK